MENISQGRNQDWFTLWTTRQKVQDGQTVLVQNRKSGQVNTWFRGTETSSWVIPQVSPMKPMFREPTLVKPARPGARETRTHVPQQQEATGAIRSGDSAEWLRGNT